MNPKYFAGLIFALIKIWIHIFTPIFLVALGLLMQSINYRIKNRQKRTIKHFYNFLFVKSTTESNPVFIIVPLFHETENGHTLFAQFQKQIPDISTFLELVTFPMYTDSTLHSPTKNYYLLIFFYRPHFHPYFSRDLIIWKNLLWSTLKKHYLGLCRSGLVCEILPKLTRALVRPLDEKEKLFPSFLKKASL